MPVIYGPSGQAIAPRVSIAPTQSVAFTAQVNQLYLVDCSVHSAAITVTLPTSAANGDMITIKKVDSTGYTVSCYPGASATVDGQSAGVSVLCFSKNQSVTLRSNGSGNWTSIRSGGSFYYEEFTLTANQPIATTSNVLLTGSLSYSQKDYSGSQYDGTTWTAPANGVYLHDMYFFAGGPIPEFNLRYGFISNAVSGSYCLNMFRSQSFSGKQTMQKYMTAGQYAQVMVYQDGISNAPLQGGSFWTVRQVA
jgi:hypothetical protein